MSHTVQELADTLFDWESCRIMMAAIISNSEITTNPKKESTPMSNAETIASISIQMVKTLAFQFATEKLDGIETHTDYSC